MTKQELFDKVVKHLHMQAKKAQGHIWCDKTICLYRGNDNCKCAFGILIEDQEYTQWMEGLSSRELLLDLRCPSTLKNRVFDHADLVEDLQEIHDMNAVDEWNLLIRVGASVDRSVGVAFKSVTDAAKAAQRTVRCRRGGCGKKT
jgi:hypothetical protein